MASNPKCKDDHIIYCPNQDTSEVERGNYLQLCQKVETGAVPGLSDTTQWNQKWNLQRHHPKATKTQVAGLYSQSFMFSGFGIKIVPV